MSSYNVLFIIPVYNAARYLERAVKSALAQTYTDYHLLIIDDGSTDGSTNIIKQFAGNNVTVWRHSNLGPGVAMNRAIEFAKNNRIPFIARMDADDISEPDRLEKQISLLERHSEIAACSSNCYYINENDDIISTSTVPLTSSLIKWELRHYLRGMVQGATTFRAGALAVAGGYRSKFRYAEEIDMYLRLAEHYELVNLGEFLYRIRLNLNSISLANSDANTLHAIYAVQCAHQRGKNKIELSFAEFVNNMNIWNKIRFKKERIFLRVRRKGISQNKILIPVAALLDPKRVIARILRYIERILY